LSSLVQVSFPSRLDQQITLKDKQGVRSAVTTTKISYPVERELEVATVTFGSIHSGTSYIKVLRDVTAEKELARNKSAFITTAAHRLRTPLSSLKWIFDEFTEGNLGSLTAKQKKLLERISGANTGMINLVNNLLNVAHIEEGRYGFTFTKVDILSVINEVVDQLNPLAHKKKITINLNDTSAMNPIHADRDLVRQSLENIVENAISYSPASSAVTIWITDTKDMVSICCTRTRRRCICRP
jgi:signal transduction histidine kinase